MIDGRVEPHRKATYTLDVSGAIRKEDRGSGFSSVKYNHKPALASGTRSTTLRRSTASTCNLSLRDGDEHGDGDSDVFVFNGSRTAPTTSYVLLFDPTTQRATLERLDSSYTFNLSTHNGADVSSQHVTIYPKKPHKDSLHDRDAGEHDLFGETQERGDEGLEPEPGNPYDFRHFLHAVKSAKEAGEAGYASSPDARSTHTATHVLPARRAVDPLAKRRKAASVFAKKPAAKGGVKKGVPSVKLERRASERPASTSTSTSTSAAKAKPSASKPSAPAPSASKIKSAEFIASSDESDGDGDVDTTHNDNDDMDIDAEGEPDSAFPSPHPHPPRHHSPSSSEDADADTDADAEGEEEDDDDDDDDDGGLEIQVPDPRPAHRRNAHLGLATHRGATSPSNGPISLASAANSVQNTPRRGAREEDEEIDFGELDTNIEGDDNSDGDGDADADAEGRRGGNVAGTGAAAKAEEVDEDDPLYMEMMEGLAGAETSEESEEE
ncbi:hypothetical protein ST47_g4760 [Ascochyta rabiei]|uniref:Transcription elongation factor Eaf N-terminal domain-containing protein n=2 Tax=Didymella rabiei TaxID=5454 RepID=A0A163F2V2_DIDRA|nr:hypothetical protein ST47_g4760 [Ascochyta rabiei]